MSDEIKNIVIIGANKKGLSLLPFILKDKKSRLVMIVDPKPDAMLFKLNELGYRIARRFDVKVSRNLDDVKKIPDLHIIINALQDPATDRFLEDPAFKDVEKLGPLSARLIWSVRGSISHVEPADSVDEQTSLLASLREIVDAVRLTIDRKELLSVILKLAIESTHADRGSIMLLSGSDDMLRVEVAKGMDEEVIRKIRVRLGEGIAGRVAKDGKPLLISGRAKSDEFNLLRQRSDVKSALCVPLIVNGEIIGVINVNSNESTHTFTREDLNFLMNLASLAAEVIHRSNDYERMRVDATKFTFWKEVDNIFSTVPYPKSLNIICKKLSEIVPGLTCFIYIYDDSRRRLILKASSIKDIKSTGPFSLHPKEGIEGWSIENAQDVVLVDRTQDGGLKRIYLSLPMMANGRLVGTLTGHVVSPSGLSIYNESLLKDIRSLIGDSLYKYLEKEREKLLSRKMFAVDETGFELVSMRDKKRIVNIIATAPSAILGAEGSILRIKHKDSKRLYMMASYGLGDKKVREYFLPIEKETVMEVLRKKNTVRRDFSEEASPYIRSILSKPLFKDNDIIGILTLFNKIDETSILPCGFSKSDEEILSRFAVYAERALSNTELSKEDTLPARDAGGSEKEEKISPNMEPREALKARVEEELNRARRYDKKFVLAIVRIAGLKDVTVENKGDIIDQLTESIKKNIRNFDKLVWLDDERLAILFLDTDEKITRVLETINEGLSSHRAINSFFMDGKIYIHYGYSIFPEDGDSFTELYYKAANSTRLHLNRKLRVI